MKNLIIIGHPDKRSFCYNGIKKTIEGFLKQNKEETCVIDLYKENITYIPIFTQNAKPIRMVYDTLVINGLI